MPIGETVGPGVRDLECRELQSVLSQISSSSNDTVRSFVLENLKRCSHSHLPVIGIRLHGVPDVLEALDSLKRLKLGPNRFRQPFS